MSVPVIKNTQPLSTTALRSDALRILEAGYGAVLTDVVLREEVELKGDDICIKDLNLCLTDYERIFFVAVGKCAVDSAGVLEPLLGAHLTDGIVLDVKPGKFTKLRSFVGTHPFSSEENIVATKAIVEMLTGLTKRDLLINVISGGGSALLCLPHQMDIIALRNITHALWTKGANISEVNIVRKHTSKILGGQLAQTAYPATIISFLFSDVPGNDIHTIASGPTVRDESSAEDAERILEKYNIRSLCLFPDCEVIETPKDKKYFDRVSNVLLVTNERALEAMRATAELLGYHAEIKDTKLEGIAREVGKTFAEMTMPAKSCFLYGGETTVKITGKGYGGRNQELALGALKTLPQGRIIVAAASDGWDNTDVAGAITDASDREKADGLKFMIDRTLEENDSYPFWRALGGSIETGRTGINVADFTIVLNG